MSSNDKKKGIRPILKNIGNFLLCAQIVVTVLTSLTFSAVMIKEKVETSRYQTTASVTQSLADYEVENVYTINSSKSGDYKRLGHNGIEPIYISFDEQYEANPQYKEMAKSAMDYIFGLVSKINPKYKYKIVSESTRRFKEVFGMSTIRFVNEDFDSQGMKHIGGEARYDGFFYDNIVDDLITKRSSIAVDFSHFEGRSESEIKYIYGHEILHVFGFDDVYNSQIIDGQKTSDSNEVDRLRGDTYMHNYVGVRTQMITPSDFATLCALYKPNVSKKKRSAENARIEKLIEEYSTTYYQAVDQRAYDYLQKQGLLKDAPVKNMKDANELAFRIVIETRPSEEDGHTELIKNVIKVKIENGRYNLWLYDKTGKLLDKCDGKVIQTDRFTILENCDFKEGILPNDERFVFEDRYITNIILFNNDGAHAYFDLEQATILPSSFLYVKDGKNSETENE